MLKRREVYAVVRDTGWCGTCYWRDGWTLTESRAKAYARGRGGTHSRSRDSQSRACVARTPAPQAPPRALRHLTIDALYCINYLGNTQ